MNVLVSFTKQTEHKEQRLSQFQQNIRIKAKEYEALSRAMATQIQGALTNALF